MVNLIDKHGTKKINSKTRRKTLPNTLFANYFDYMLFTKHHRWSAEYRFYLDKSFTRIVVKKIQKHRRIRAPMCIQDGPITEESPIECTLLTQVESILFKQCSVDKRGSIHYLLIIIELSFMSQIKSNQSTCFKHFTFRFFCNSEWFIFPADTHSKNKIAIIATRAHIYQRGGQRSRENASALANRMKVGVHDVDNNPSTHPSISSCIFLHIH